MPRIPRVSPDGAIHHVINRGNRRARIFHEPADYDAFMNLLCDVMDHVPMRILGVCVMPNHFHLVLWPLKGRDLSAYMHWLMTAHVQRYHRHHGTLGLGHLYQGRYRNFLIQSDGHLYNVLRYVEGNALRANLVSAAERWRWSSLGRRFTPDGRAYLSDWPVPRPADWTDFVNTGIASEEIRRLRFSLRRGAPYGDQWWVRKMISQYGLESTLRPRGRRSRVTPGVVLGFE